MIRIVTREELFDMGIDLDEYGDYDDKEEDQIGVDKFKDKLNDDEFKVNSDDWRIYKYKDIRLNKSNNRLCLQEPSSMTIKEMERKYGDLDE